MRLRRRWVTRAVRKLLLWQDPVFSAAVFGILNLVFYLLIVCDFTVLSLVAFLAAVHLAVTVLFVVLGGFIARFQGGTWTPAV